MLELPSSGFPYHLIAGHQNHYFWPVVTEDGHIEIHNPSRQTTGKLHNLRDITQYDITVEVADTWFTLHQGQEVTLQLTTELTYIQIRLHEVNSSAVYHSVSSSVKTATWTVEEDTDIGSVSFRNSASVNAGSSGSFDVALYVDGVRYF